MYLPARSYRLFVGVDIAAASFAATWTQAGPATERARSFVQTPDGFAAFQAQLASTGIAPADTLIVLEATGSYWITLAVTFHQAGYAVSVVNPAQIHAFARSLPRRAKTDALDAALLAQFALERQPERWTPPEQVYHELRQRLLVRDGLLTMRGQARNQRHALEQWPVQIAGALEQLDAVIAELDKRTTNPIESTFATARLRQRVTKEPGSRAAGVAMAFKLIESAQHRWRAVNAPHLVVLVRTGAVFENGKLVERSDESGGEIPAA